MIFICLNYSKSFSNDDFSSFNNSTEEERLLRNETLSLELRCHSINRPDLSSRSCESQARSSSRRFTVNQNKT